MIVTSGQATKLLPEALHTYRHVRGAITVRAPIPKDSAIVFNNGLFIKTAPQPHRHMMCRVKLRVAISPQVPTIFPSNVAPSASHSLLLTKDRTSRKVTVFSQLNGFPSVCASIIAFVLGVIASSIKSALMLCVFGSTSTNTGIAPNCTIGLTVVKSGATYNFITFLDGTTA